MPLKLQPLRVFLLKSNSGLPVTALRDFRSLRRYGLHARLPFKGSLWVREDPPDDASWVDFVRPNVSPDLVVKTATSAAVLILEVSGRYFAFVFGHGRSLLERTAFVRDFGLRVTLNAVKPASLRSIDTKTFESLTLLARRQTSRASSLDMFGLNVSQDLVQAVAGEPRDETLAHRIAGSDALAFSSRLEFTSLADKCAALLEMYGRDTYKDSFPFIDRLRRISDPVVIEELEAELNQQLMSRQLDRMHLAAPEIENPEVIEGISYSSEPNEVFPDLDLEDFLRTLHTGAWSLTADALKRQHVVVRYAEGGTPEKWSVFECLTAEIDRRDRLYILSAGEWFEADQGFANQIAARVALLAANPLPLLPARPNEIEPKYNARVGKKLGHLVIDGNLARCHGTNPAIEVCDLLTAARKFVHVKRKTRSATLSHLFAQGVVSAEAFLVDAVFRQDARDLVEAQNPALVSLIPTGPPVASDYGVAYAIITNRLANWPRTLPFFSQVNLCNAADRLERLSFQVSLTGVPIL